MSRDFNYDESSSSKALTTSKPLSNPVKEIKEVAKSEDDDDDDYEVSQSQSVSKHWESIEKKIKEFEDKSKAYE